MSSSWRHVAMWATVLSFVIAGGIAMGEVRPECTTTVQPGESIQEAIDAAEEGAVICLSPGEWRENLLIEKSLTLRAAEIESEPQAVIRSGRWGWPVIRIESEEPIDVTIQGLKITRAFGVCYKGEPDWICAYGISVHGKATANIEDNTISGNKLSGIVMRDSSQATVKANAISGNRDGIRMVDSSRATIKGSAISDNQYGIWMRDSAQATIRDSAISDSAYGIRMALFSQAMIEGNTISGNRLSGIWKLDSAQATIKGNTINGNDRDGIRMENSSQVTITESTIFENRWRGIELGGSAKATITESTISGNERDGIGLGGTAEATFERNEILHNGRYGVALLERPCFLVGVFTGYATGEGNTGEGNADGDYCPENLAFLFTEEGGELDRRE